jgi:hypothetical protein
VLIKGGSSLKKIELKVPLENIENILGTVTNPSIVLSELIKNSVDSNAEYIRIDICSEPDNRILVTDRGDGFSFENIKNLGIISESDKKINDNLYRKDGSFLTGSKGLGILSLFSIANKFIMETERDKVRYRVIWSKGQSAFTCEQISSKNANGTEIIITDIDDEYMAILTDENELNKLKHISIKNYIKSNLTEKSILFFINGRSCTELDISHINDLKENFIGLLSFNYESNINTLNFQYISDNSLINRKKIAIKLNDDLNISNILINNYNLSKITRKGELCKYLRFPLESFSGEIFVTEQRKNKGLHKFGPGVRIFVNQFAIYGYLDKENDWLNFSVYSMLLKNTRYKPHNVFGYVHFQNLNENKSHLKISNERAYFIENGAYKKFQEIMKNIITTLAFNIDVAEKNGLINNISTKEDSQENYEQNKSDSDSHNPSYDNQNCYPQNEARNDRNKSENTETNSIERVNNDKKPSEEDFKLSKPSNNQDPQSEQSPTIAQDKKPQFNFFKTSRVLKHPDKTEIEYDELINQLSKLDYKKFYLLFVIGFRAILEDISKKYLNVRGINLHGDFGQNVKTMTDDILQIVKDPSIIKTQDKIYIENLIGGYNAFKNYFETIGIDFYCNGNQGIKAKALNSFAHNPRWMEIEEAENMANNTILPLYVVSKEIIGRMKK